MLKWCAGATASGVPRPLSRRTALLQFSQHSLFFRSLLMESNHDGQSVLELQELALAKAPGTEQD
eukprot:3498442-Amphidinium_carterae.2